MKTTYLNGLRSDLTKGRLDRRQFITSALVLGVALPSAMTMADRAIAATPKKGGRLRQGLGFGSTTDSLDPATYENGFSQNLVYTFGNHLTEVSNTGELIPELAESYESSSDAATWRFNLRKGVEFHNGKSLTADDVIASFNYHRSEDSKSAAKGLLTAVKDVTKDGDSTVVFTLESGNAGFPFIVSDYHLVILPSKDGIMDWASGKGTGGYIIENYEPGVRAILKRNPNYWKENAAYFDEIETLAILDTSVRQSAVINGDVDMSNTIDPKNVHLLKRVGHVNMLETTGTRHYTFPMRVDVGPFDNADVRMALKLVVDRKEMVDKILLGHGSQGNDHPISSSDEFYAASLPIRAYDPDQAKALLKKAGAEGLTVDLSASDAAFPGAVDAALLLKNSAEKAGININIVREPNDGYWSNVWNKKPWCACYWGGRPTADWMFSSAYTDDTEWNDTAWKTTDGAVKFNKIVREARTELDRAKRQELYTEAQRLISDDGGSIIPMFANHIHALSNKLGHADAVAGNWENDGNKSAERWWFV